MAARKTKKPWNHGLKIPGLLGEPEHPLPKPMPTPTGPAAALTTGMMIKSNWQCLRCERLKLGKDVTELDHSPRCEWRDRGDPSVS
jgi:hypothetical protein